MRTEDLIAVGLTGTEAKLYQQLAIQGTADAKKLISQTGMHKKIVYDNLYRLLDKGLLSVVEFEGRKQFRMEPADALKVYVEKEEQEVQRKKVLATKLAEEIKSLKHKETSNQTAAMLIGTQGVRQVFLEILDQGNNYIAIGAPKESLAIMGESFWHNLHAKQAEKKVNCRLLFNESLRSWAKDMPKKWNKIRFLKLVTEPMTETIVNGSKTAIIVWSPKPVVTLIDDSEVADSYRAFFELLWQQASD